jgi:hypothetical protein
MTTPIEWHESVERLLLEFASEAQCRAKLHMKQFMSYRRRNQWWSLPVVVLSVISGSGSFISEGYEELTKKYMVMTIGTVSIFVSIISAISQFLKLAQLEESNRLCSLGWGKFFSKIRNQLYLKRGDREVCHDFMLNVFASYERLYEMSPPLLSKFIKSMKKKLKGRNLQEILPFYMNGIDRVVTYEDYDFENNTDDDLEAPLEEDEKIN